MTKTHHTHEFEIPPFAARPVDKLLGATTEVIARFTAQWRQCRAEPENGLQSPYLELIDVTVDDIEIIVRTCGYEYSVPSSGISDCIAEYVATRCRESIDTVCSFRNA